MHNFNDFLNDDGYTPSISTQTNPRGNLYSTNVVQSAFPRSVHVVEVAFLTLVSNCLHLRLVICDVVIYHNDCVLIVNFFQTYCHRVCLITRVLELDILFTSTNVKTILAGAVFTSDVKTLRNDLDPTSQPWTLQTTQSQCSTCWPRPHLGNSLPHLRLKQLSFFSSAAIHHDVFHHLPFEFLVTSGIFWFLLVHVLLQLLGSPVLQVRTQPTTSSSVVPRSALLRLTSRCLHCPSHAACGLAVLHSSPRVACSGYVVFLMCFMHSS